MKKQAIYSGAPRTPVPRPLAEPLAPAPVGAAGAAPQRAPRWRRMWRATKGFCQRHERPVLLVVGACLALLIVLGHHAVQPEPQRLTQKDIDAAVIHVLEKVPLPSQATRAAAVIAPSVVRVRGFRDMSKDAERKKTAIKEAREAAKKAGKPFKPPKPEVSKELAKNPSPADKRKLKGKPRATPEQDDDLAEKKDDGEIGVGSGVVIVENGTILTNLHVVMGADKIKVTFFNGVESEADIISVRPEHDLAVIKAKTLPDDLTAATMRTTSDLQHGDLVVAVGFPFGIGPSTSAGVISGLKREFRSPEGKRILTNLIQFDAPANPGNSGGPLVTSEGEVVGIVTGILNPTGQRVSIGISFAVPIENAASALGMHPF